MEINLGRNAKDPAAGIIAGLAWDEAWLGQCRQAGDDGRRALELAHTSTTLMNVMVAAASCGDAARALAVASELEKLYPKDAPVTEFAGKK